MFGDFEKLALINIIYYLERRCSNELQNIIFIFVMTQFNAIGLNQSETRA